VTATYRLQLQREFGFAEVESLLPYFERLGVSHLYLSPITEARAGSTHGYDVTDHNAVRAEYGGREGLDRLLDAAHARGLGVLFDWVPNHAGVGPHNVYWQDVLAYGPASLYARYFDVDWDPLKPELRGKVLLPFLGRPYGEALDAGEIAVAYEDGRFWATYFENRFALSPASYARLLEAALPHYERAEPYWDLKDLVEAYRGVRPHEREKAETLRPRLAVFAEREDPKAWLGTVQGEALHGLLEAQCWRLAHWRTAGHEINYRRFFDVNDLVGLRMEDDHVFWDAHRLLGELLAHPAVAGVRIDHVDGLFDPHDYLDKLRELGARHVWVEKILAPGETLPEAWAVEGATGYAFMNDALHTLLAPEGEAGLDRAWRRFVPEAASWATTVYESKRLVMATSLSSELFRLAYGLDRLSEADYHTRDFTLEALREALAEIVAAVGRYRTYLPYDDEDARTVVAEAVHRAKQRNPALEPTAFDFVARVALGDGAEELREQQRAWVGRLQQYTAPVAAKGVEDTAFYRYFRLTALNEVGGDPDRWAMDAQAFHARARFRAHRFPRNLLATATHDHKRGEDTRMRLVVLSEIPDRWEETVQALAAAGERHRGPQGPSPADQYLAFQTLAALWQPPPGVRAGAYRAALADRLWPYLQKAAREAKEATSWINPSEPYERDFERWARALCTDAQAGAVLDALSAAMARLGFANTLSQLVLKLTLPGVPDFYQGTELLDLSLVDPDNRRPVDYALRQRMLDELENLLDAPEHKAVGRLIEEQDVRAKLYVTARLLRLRRARPALFEDGGYRALELAGEGADGWLAFAREAEGDAVVVLVPRYPARMADSRAATLPLPEDLAGNGWTEWLSGATVPATARHDLPLAASPWAVLVRA
jgi:(1->4)-alpha-D-glucan 1-alpha-D-glucosylmutase